MMDSTVRYFENIWIEPPMGRILYRLGYKKTKTKLDDNQRERIEELIWQGVSHCHPRGAFLILPITKRTEDSITIGRHLVESKSLTELLKNSEEVALMASTIGDEIIHAIEQEIKQENSVKAVIYDSTASQIADKTVAWVMDFINKSLQKEAKELTSMRFSPGYGDLDLKYQKIFFEELKLEKLGIRLTETYMMTPEKSVTAICGVENRVRREDQ
ncbi:vitamin B12 dependent-methionine synthase activation domain-containing protein [Defluviitalea saccharophila]|uniref:Vitamin B12 dependent-methionine synthase activation domain-containing protein n=1 Tax=Defluviitalea saccharophila TaxID=879970 RepID=A0ABZ2Y1Q3_9FIRM